MGSNGQAFKPTGWQPVLPGIFGFVLIRLNLTADGLSVLTHANEIQSRSVFFAWVCDSYLLVLRVRVRIGCKRGRAGHL